MSLTLEEWAYIGMALFAVAALFFGIWIILSNPKRKQNDGGRVSRGCCPNPLTKILKIDIMRKNLKEGK